MFHRISHVLLSMAAVLPGLAALPSLAQQTASPIAAAQPSVASSDTASMAHGLIVRDSLDVPHICAATESEAYFALGYVHAEDRFFQMDTLRRRFSGTVSELVGAEGLDGDVEFRNFGIRRSAEESLLTLQAENLNNSLTALESYAEGVNFYLANHPLPPEYTALELTSVPPWDVVDSLTILKGTLFGLSFDLVDLDLTRVATAYQEAGEVAGFDGLALFFEDVFRLSPIDPTVTIPGRFDPSSSKGPSPMGGVTQQVRVDPAGSPIDAHRVAALAQRTRDRLAGISHFKAAFDPARGGRGSNWWLVDGAHSVSGHAMLASDPHLELGTPATFYEAHLMTSSEQRCGIPADGQSQAPAATLGLNVSGMTIPGVPSVVAGCNEKMCWGSTVNPVDVTDVYQEILVLDPQTGLPSHTIFEGQPEAIQLIPQSFRANQIGDGANNNLATADIRADEGGLTFIVPRRNQGPLVGFEFDGEGAIGLSVQYTGARGTTELETLLRAQKATTPEAFKAALQFYDTGSQNWAYADVEGNIAYFASGELPIREDLQTMGAPDGGVPPNLVRDGTHTLKHEWMATTNPQPQQSLSYEILPFDEMPQEINPARGYIANANNDPIGTVLDNNPWNQSRAGGGALYLGTFYSSLRIGRIDRMLRSALEGGGKISLEDMQRIQSNNQMLDAELVSPSVIHALRRAQEPDAPVELSAFAQDPQIVEAVDRLEAWDFSSPTGIAQGYDPGDDPSNLGEPSSQEIAYSVAASIWAVYRSELIERLILAPQSDLGLESFRVGNYESAARLLLNWDENQGVGASGLFFFETGTGLEPADGRDLILLQVLAATLERLAGPDLAPAFGGSTDQDDYRWGLLHRIVFAHPLGPAFSVPELDGFEPVSPRLNGLARAGGYEVVDSSSHDPFTHDPNGFMFDGGPVRRFAGIMDPASIEAYDVLPGGQSGVPGDPNYASQLRLWLTNRTHPVLLTPQSVGGDIKEEIQLGDGGSCVKDARTLCLQDHRFAVSVDWRTPENQTGQGLVVPGAAQDSGIFSFFSLDNWEMLVKVLDGCENNGHFWVFASSATNVEWQLRVLDTQNGATWTAMNRQGTRSPAITATDAFLCP